MEKLIRFLETSPTAAAAAENVSLSLLNEGFTELYLKDSWKLSAGGRYFVRPAESSLTAFAIPEKTPASEPFFRIIGAHLDSPCLRIKPSPAMKDGSYYRLNAEVYGGPIYSSWFDRPLSLAGTVTLKGTDPFHPVTRLVDLKEPVLVIPNLAIHMNREVNDGVKLNPQSDLLPVGALAASLEGDPLTEALTAALGVEADDILDFDLFTYLAEKPALVGFKKEFISAARLDDLIMAKSALDAFLAADLSAASGVNVLALFDHEEVGSESRQGADSDMLRLVLEKLALGLGLDRSAYLGAAAGSLVISADVAHAIHPAHPEKHDPLLRTQLGQGPVIKVSARQAYVSHSAEYSVFEELCRKAGVPVQKFANRSDVRGGSTIGPAISSWLPCRCLDMGIALLAMHSSRELAAVADFDYTRRAFKEFYSL